LLRRVSVPLIISGCCGRNTVAKRSTRRTHLGSRRMDIPGTAASKLPDPTDRTGRRRPVILPKNNEKLRDG